MLDTMVCSGFHDVYGALYRQLGLDRILVSQKYRVANEVLLHTVMAHLASTQSKGQSARKLGEELGVRLSPAKTYRMMDLLDNSRIEQIKQLAVDRARLTSSQPIYLLLFDGATVNFESYVADRLKPSGFSKDAKFKESPQLLALMFTEQGLPVGYELLPGASDEAQSLIPLVEKLRRGFKLEQIIVVADNCPLSRQRSWCTKFPRSADTLGSQQCQRFAWHLLSPAPAPNPRCPVRVDIHD